MKKRKGTDFSKSLKTVKGGESVCINLKKGEKLKGKLSDSSLKKSIRRTEDGQDIHLYRKRKEK